MLFTVDLDGQGYRSELQFRFGKMYLKSRLKLKAVNN